MTDHYSLIEAAARELMMKQLTAYFEPETAAIQVTKSDDTVYDKGFDYFATTYPGAFPVVPIAAQTISVSWEVIIDLLTRWGTRGGPSEAESWAKFIDFRSSIFNLFNGTNMARNLSRTVPGVKSVVLSTEDRPRYIPVDYTRPSAGPAFIAQACVLTVEEIINKT